MYSGGIEGRRRMPYRGGEKNRIRSLTGASLQGKREDGRSSSSPEGKVSFERTWRREVQGTSAAKSVEGRVSNKPMPIRKGNARGSE